MRQQGSAGRLITVSADGTIRVVDRWYEVIHQFDEQAPNEVEAMLLFEDFLCSRAWPRTPEAGTGSRGRLLVAVGLYGLALAAYVTSFFLPAFVVVGEGKEEASYGYAVFVICFINAWGLGGPVPFLVWLANHLFWAGYWLLLKRRGLAAACLAALAIALALTIVGPLLLVGYYLWLASFVLRAAAGLCLLSWRYLRVG